MATPDSFTNSHVLALLESLADGKRHAFLQPTASIPTPIPGHGKEPPILPNHKFSGAAARAAAAAQNERVEMAKIEMARAERERFLDSKFPQDSESGANMMGPNTRRISRFY